MILREGFDSPLSRLDPFGNHIDPPSVAIYETIVVKGLDGAAHPALAASWSIAEDGLTWRFQIRPGLRFHSGDACDAMAETDVTGLLGNVTAPTLVLHGVDDCLTPLDCGPDGARKIHEGIAGSELYLLEGCGHGVLLERPDEAVGKVIAFLKGA